jgi:hypothetical protein
MFKCSNDWTQQGRVLKEQISLDQKKQYWVIRKRRGDRPVVSSWCEAACQNDAPLVVPLFIVLQNLRMRCEILQETNNVTH